MKGVYDAIIVGAGIVGAACADEFSRRGMRLAIVDPNAGCGTTAAGMGHIVVMDHSDAEFALTRYSQTLWNELSPQLPREVEHECCGTIWVALDEMEMEEVARKHGYYDERDVPTLKLCSRSLCEQEPNLAPMLGGLLVLEDSVIYPPAAARFLLHRALKRGATLVESLVDFMGAGYVDCGGAIQLEAQIVVNAAGFEAPSLTPGLEIQKRKGHLVITDRYPGFVRHQLVELGYLKSAHSSTADSVAFNIQPRRNGQLLIGSSRQYGADDLDVDRAILAQMLRRAELYLPSLGGCKAIRSWTGFRPATPSGLPLIGPHPADRSLFLAAGHEGLGITTSLGTAALLADLVTGKTTKIPIAPYLPSRCWETCINA